MPKSKITTDKEKWQNRIVRNEMILQSIGEGVCVVDKENRISYTNSSARKMLGWEEEDLLFRRYEPILFGTALPQENEVIISPIQFALQEGETIHVNTETFYRQDGTSFLVEYVCIPLRENDEIVGVVVTFQDISERRDLESAVSQARDTAIEAAQEKANFLANMSHEIRTPLNGIIGITSLLAETNLAKEQRDYVETLQTSSNLLLDIVNDILDFSRIEAGKLELEEIDFDLQQIIAETLRLFTPQAIKKKIQLEFEIQETEELALRGDAGRLRQILNNLLGNAIKFTEKGKVSLKISQENNEFWRFEIIDTGIGIKPEKQTKIFEPFSQADISTTRQFGGTGLGLAISKQLVQMMSGEIGVESEYNQGSKFWFTAKLEKQRLDIYGEAGFINEPPLIYKPNELRVLVVEDNLINQEVAIGRLRQLGIYGDVAGNGLAAVKILQNKEYDLVLMDCRMPEMDGFEATRQIRQINNHLKRPQIIAMTASVTIEEREKCLLAGMDDYLAKPMTIEALAQMLNKHFSLTFAPQRLDVEENFIQHPFAQILDANTLKNFLEIEARGEKHFVEEMLSLYLKHTDTQLSELKNAFDNRNPEIVKSKAHALRGSSGNIGLNDLFEEFTNLEEIVENDLIEAEKILNRILQKFLELKTKVSYLSEFGD